MGNADILSLQLRPKGRFESCSCRANTSTKLILPGFSARARQSGRPGDAVLLQGDYKSPVMCAAVS